MANFCNLFENMDYNKKLKEEQIEMKAVEAIQKGLQLDDDFWRNFLLLINNSDALGALLNVKSEKVNTWRHNVKKYLTKYYEKETDEVANIQKKKKFVSSKDYRNFM